MFLIYSLLVRRPRIPLRFHPFQHSLPLLISQLVQMHLSPLSIFVRSALKRRWVDTDGLCRGKHGKSRWAGSEEYTWGEGILGQRRCKSTWVYLQTWTVGINTINEGKIINNQWIIFLAISDPFLALIFNSPDPDGPYKTGGSIKIRKKRVNAF